MVAAIGNKAFSCLEAITEDWAGKNYWRYPRVPLKLLQTGK